MGEGRRSDMTRGRTPTVGLHTVSLVFAIVLVVVGWSGPAEAQSTPVCDGQTQAPTEQEPEHKPAVLVQAAGQRTVMPFGRDRDERRLQLQFDVTECEFREADVRLGEPLGPKPGFEARWFPVIGDDGNELKTVATECRDDVCIRTPAVIESRSRVVVDVYVDPAGDARPGTYQSVVLITDSRSTRAQVPITLTLQYNRGKLLAATVFLPVIVIGWLLVWWKGRLAIPSADSAWSWWTKFGNLLAVGAGLAAARGVWSKTYLEVPGFGADLQDDSWFWWPLFSGQWWTLVTLVGTAYVGALTAATLGGDRARNGPDNPPGGGPIRQALRRRASGPDAGAGAPSPDSAAG